LGTPERHAEVGNFGIRLDRAETIHFRWYLEFGSHPLP
jgi:hypothetical protein